jgi:hypothetical protein
LFDVLESVADHSQLVDIEQRHLDLQQPMYNSARLATNIAAGTGPRKTQADATMEARQRQLAVAAALDLFNRLQRSDDVSAVLLAFDSLSLSGVLEVYMHRDLAIAAYSSGVLSGRDFLAFLQAGYRGLYHETQQEIRERKGLKRGQDISDYMGSLETAANIFRAALAKQLLADRGVTELSTANATHHEAGDSVRSLLVSKGIHPERLPTPTKSYQQLLREEEARQHLLAEDQTGLWAQLLAGRDSNLGAADDDAD